MDATLNKFGYPTSLIFERNNWMILLRPQQVTLGALALIEKSGVTRYSDISLESHAELGEMIRIIEPSFSQLFKYDKINYLMLMMVDPEVHFHVVPRYAETREFMGVVFRDPGWPGLPDMTYAADLTDDAQGELIDKMCRQFLSNGGSSR